MTPANDNANPDVAVDDEAITDEQLNRLILLFAAYLAEVQFEHEDAA